MPAAVYKRATEAIGAWWLPRSSKPVVREQRTVGSIPIRLRQFSFIDDRAGLPFRAAAHDDGDDLRGDGALAGGIAIIG